MELSQVKDHLAISQLPFVVIRAQGSGNVFFEWKKRKRREIVIVFSK